MTADKSSVQVSYNATIMVEELSPNSYSRDFLVVSAPIKDTSWLRCDKTGIPIQGGNSEREQDFIQCSPLKCRHSSRLEKRVFFPLRRICTREH